MTAPRSQSVLILGAGLTGLTIAHHLRHQDHHVTLLDHPEWRDGFGFNPSDPGPILLGCHRESHHLLQTLAQPEPLTTPDQPMPLAFRLPSGQEAVYESARLPGAVQWMMSLFSFQGLAWQDRWRLFSHVEQIWEQADTRPADLENRTAQEWLTATGQSPDARERIWGPLAEWLTGNDPSKLSAATFVHVLSTVFLSDASDAKLLSVSGSIEQRFIVPMQQSLPHDRMEIRTLTGPPLLRFKESRLQDVKLPDGTTLQPQWYIVALPHQQLRALLPERILTRLAYFAHMTDLADLGEIVVHVKCRSSAPTARLVLLPGQTFQRFTIRPTGPEKMVCRLSARTTALENMHEDQVRDAAIAELLQAFPSMASQHISVDAVVQEPHAALSLAPGTARLRPLQQGPISNLLVAGAWTDTGWPANLESALVSARRCAERILGKAH